MVKQIKLLTFFLLLSAVCFIGCNIDLPGLVIANDLDDRLKDRDNFKFLDGKNSKGEDRNWRTLNEGTDYSFIVLSDTHIEKGKGLSKDKNIYLGTLADIIKNSDKKIEFVIITGDITQDAAVKDIDKFIEIADSLGVPCYPVAGNHDVYYRDDKNKGWSQWREKIGSTNYRIDGDSTTLLILDTANAFFGKEQLDWLEREMKTAKTNAFVFAHAPLFVVGPVDMQQSTDTKERARVVSILKKNKCDMMFMGHLHKHMVNKAGGVEYLSLASFIDESAYYVVTVSSGSVKWERKSF